MGLTLVGDIATLQTQFETIKEEVDKQFDKTILNLEETSWAIIRKKRDFLLRTTDWTMTPGCTVDQSAHSSTNRPALVGSYSRTPRPRTHTHADPLPLTEGQSFDS